MQQESQSWFHTDHGPNVAEIFLLTFVILSTF